MSIVKLNVLQRLFRSWETVYPYNAAQAVKLRTAPDSASVSSAWNAALAALQLGPTRINCQTLIRLTLPTQPDDLAGSLLTPSIALTDHLSAELNRPFADDVDAVPFRPFLVRDGEGAWIGLTYRHCVADSISIRQVLRGWLDHLTPEKPCARGPLTQVDDSYWKLFAARDGRVRLDQTISTFIRGHQRLRTAQKPATAGERDYPVRVMLGQAPDGMIETLRQECRERQIRVSDVMLTALLKIARDHVPLQVRGNRQDVAVGCIVNLRPYARRNLSDVFGLYLGFTSVVCSPRDFSSRSALMKTVQNQTSMQRELGIAPACTVWVNAGLTLGRFMPKPRLYHFYRKSMPLAAGLSSVRVGPDDCFGPEVVDYVRISPTGPIAPAVLSTTEVNGKLSLALTYRPAVVSEQSASTMLDDFVQALRIS
jgi:NRPS condensation-like uncharacterized protein